MDVHRPNQKDDKIPWMDVHRPVQKDNKIPWMDKYRLDKDEENTSTKSP